jgi:hypothetical protein
MNKLLQVLKNISSRYLPTIILSLILVAGIAYAWSEPSVAPPGNNVAAPLNVGINFQYKTGGLEVNRGTTGGHAEDGLNVANGNVFIGDLTSCSSIGTDSDGKLSCGTGGVTGYERKTFTKYDTNVNVTCSSGKRALGGGCKTNGKVVAETYLEDDEVTWHCHSDDEDNMTAYVICAWAD